MTQSTEPNPDTHAGIRNTLVITAKKLLAKEQSHHYLEREITIDRIQSAIYWLDALEAKQNQEAMNAK